MTKHCSVFLPMVFLILLFCGCGSRDALKAPEPGSGARGSTPLLMEPLADGAAVIGNDYVSADISHMDQGYIMLQWLKKSDAWASVKIKMQITGPANITYTYNLSADGEWHVYPLTDGSGGYTVNVFENIEGNQYFQVFSGPLEVVLSDELLPFVYPNEYVSFDASTRAVSLAEELAADSDDDLDVIYAVFYYVVTNITYDDEKAASVKSDYLPAVDDTLAAGTGICFDYASLMAAMLRSQGIPTMLDIGYIGTVYHAWISAWVEDTGWLYNIIEFDGTSWNMMDPTLASTESSGHGLSNYINNGDSYFVKYSY